MSAAQTFPPPGLPESLEPGTHDWAHSLQATKLFVPARQMEAPRPPVSTLDHAVPPPPVPFRPKLLLTIPVHNEARFIRTTVELVDLALSQSGIDYVLAIAEDGSTDGTKEILRRLKQEMPELLLRMEPEKLGRGKALRQIWKDVPADFYAFCDTDLATDAETLVSLVRRALSGNEIVVGSRYAEGAVVQRPPLRAWVSRVYNWYVRNSFRDGILDHQCGLKIFSRRVVDELLDRTQEDSWFWDTEILVLARRHGFAVDEVAVPWVEKKTRRTSYRRLISDIGLHGAGLLRLKGQSGAPLPASSKVSFPAQECLAGPSAQER